MGVKFTPEKPDSVMEIVSTSLKHEQRNASLLHYVGVQTAQVETLHEEMRALISEEKELTERAVRREEENVLSEAIEIRDDKMARKIQEVVEGYEATLHKLCPIMVSLCDVISAHDNPRGELTLKGCRPDTLTDHLRLVDVAIKELYNRAAAIPTASGNEWLRDFLEPKAVVEHPNVRSSRCRVSVGLAFSCLVQGSGWTFAFLRRADFAHR